VSVNISHFFIDWPIFASLLSIVITIVGGVALMTLPIARWRPFPRPAYRYSWIHTGMVSVLHEETFDTIEGNTNDEGSANGYEVCARNRAFSSQIDFIRIS
jgi:hypothetical protein